MSFTAPGTYRKGGRGEVEAEEYKIPTPLLPPPTLSLLSCAQIALYPYKPFIQWISKNGGGPENGPARLGRFSFRR